MPARFDPRIPGSYRNALLGLAIVVAAVLAHGGCLKAIFYLDDWWQIVDSDNIETGRWWSAGTNAFTYLTYWATWKIAGYSAPAFHLGNLLLHIVLALCILRFSHIFLGELAVAPRVIRDISALAALIFAVHPLTSEITHYARARDHELVTLFSFLSAVSAVLWIRRGWRWFPALLGCIVASTFSKGPGLWHATLNIGIALICFGRATDWRARFPNRWWIYGSIVIVEGLICAFATQLVSLVLLPLNEVHDWRFGWHLLTQSRVVWRYVWRMVIPIRLCSDHLVAWTRSLSDLTAWLAVIGLLFWMGLTVWLWCRRRRLAAMLSAMILAPLLLRFGYVVSELMVEYRTYPAIPWLALLTARVLMPYQSRSSTIVRATAIAVVVLLGGLTAIRSQDWRSTTALTSNILRQYPLQLRAYNGLSSADVREGRYQAVLDRSPEFFGKLDELMAVNRTNSIRYYDIWPLCAVSEECNIADALLEIEGPATARSSLMRAADRMRVSGIQQQDLWALWHFTMGKIELRAGNIGVAQRQFSRVDRIYFSQRVIDREWAKAVR